MAAELLRADSPLHELEEEARKYFHFEGGEALPLDTFEIVDQGTRAEIEERALPFQVGDEVLVRIEEPHMYNAEDAIARVDTYIVSVTGAGALMSATAAWCGSRASDARRRPHRWPASRRALPLGTGNLHRVEPRATTATVPYNRGPPTAPRPTRRQATFPRNRRPAIPSPMARSATR